ncbi:MAG: YfhO family protein [Bacteroidales bacterium]|nr:YfhO family protein [Bacteroidales bacterium]
MNTKKKIELNHLKNENTTIIDTLIEKYGFIIFLILSFFVAVFIFKSFFDGTLLYFFKDIGSDSINITFPNFIQGENLNHSDGIFKTWTFYTGMGQRLTNPITLNPITNILRVFQAFFGVDLWFYRIYLYYFLYFLPIGIIGFYYFRTLGYSKFTAIIGGLLLQFSGYLIVGSQWGHAHKILYSVFLYFSFEQLLLKKRWIYFVLALYLLSDNVFLLSVNAIFLAFYSLVRFLNENDGKLKGYFPLLGKMIGLAVLGIAINAPRATSNFLTMFQSPRVSGSVNQAKILIENPEILDGFLRRVTTILRFFGNDLLGSGSEFRGWYNYLEAALFYIGIISLVLISFSFSFFNKKQKIFYGLFLSFWILVAFIPILRHTVNLFMGNYFKNSIDIFVPFTVLFFAMFSLENIQKGNKINPLTLIVVLGGLLVLLHFPYFDFTDAIVNPKMKITISIFILCYGAIIYFLSIKKNTALFKIILLLLVTFEVSYISWFSVNEREVYVTNEFKGDMAGYKDGTIEVVNYIAEQDSSLFYRMEKDYSSGNSQHSSLNDAKAQGFYSTPSYGSFNQKYYIRFLEETDVIDKGNEGQTRWATGVRGIPLLMTFANVKYYLARDYTTNIKLSGYDSIGIMNDILILKNKYYLPFGYSYNKYLPIGDFRKLSKFKKQEALLSAVILEDEKENFNMTKLDTNLLAPIDSFNFDIYSSMIDSLRLDTFEISSFINKKIEGKINLSSDKMLFFTIPYDRDWRIFVDGKKAKKVLANTGFIGIYLKKGEHQIQMKYLSPYFEETLITAIIALLVLGLMIIIRSRKSKQKK